MIVRPPDEMTDAAVREDDDLLAPELLRAAVDGEPTAVAALLGKIQPQVQRFCRARLGRRETTMGSADDVAQDVCMAVLAVLPDYRFSGVSFRAFVFGIARHKIADAFRTMARNRSDAVADLDTVSDPLVPDPEQALLEEERNSRLGDLIGVLGPRQVEILTLRIAVGLTAEETAGALGSTPGAVRVAQHRALRRIRREAEERAAKRSNNRAPLPHVGIASEDGKLLGEGVAELDQEAEDVLLEKLADAVLPPSRSVSAATTRTRTVEDAHREYRSAVRSAVHTVAGLGNLDDVTRHRSFTAELGGRLNLDAGLAALRRSGHDANEPGQAADTSRRSTG